jgi:DNA-binding NarL/FixJ family response regulator
MPRVDGLEAAGQILGEDPGQPVILFSAYLTDEMRAAASALGVRACVEKNDVFSIPEVIRTHARRP